ncbi:hypothetical protein BDV96DRAFT_644679 [Lophiotrema nucula]|uniref:Uncharacterized protein n=1 Tax=Lophiotrema nucula TaxID=690887 RepID=A0A6A5ZDW0_9PLEO|nr:hypothetical protein BDV96DRAFT_644679 [Lophiotrema nucula]
MARQRTDRGTKGDAHSGMDRLSSATRGGRTRSKRDQGGRKGVANVPSLTSARYRGNPKFLLPTHPAKKEKPDKFSNFSRRGGSSAKLAATSKRSGEDLEAQAIDEAVDSKCVDLEDGDGEGEYHEKNGNQHNVHDNLHVEASEFNQITALGKHARSPSPQSTAKRHRRAAGSKARPSNIGIAKHNQHGHQGYPSPASKISRGRSHGRKTLPSRMFGAAQGHTVATIAQSSHSVEMTVTEGMFRTTKPSSNKKYSVGDLIKNVHPEMQYDENEPIGRTAVPSFYGAVSIKNRTDVVTEIIGRTQGGGYGAYTFKGEGLRKKKKSHYLALWDLTYRPEEEQVNETPYPPIIVQSTHHRIEVGTYLDISRPVSIDFNNHVKSDGRVVEGLERIHELKTALGKKWSSSRHTSYDPDEPDEAADEGLNYGDESHLSLEPHDPNSLPNASGGEEGRLAPSVVASVSAPTSEDVASGQPGIEVAVQSPVVAIETIELPK